MHVLWDHHSATVAGQPIIHPMGYDSDGGVVACWQNNDFLHFTGVPEGEPLRPPWSALLEPGVAAALVKRLLDRSAVTTGALSANTADAYPDAIVAYAWTGELVQVAVARTTLSEEAYTDPPPEWYVTGKAPRKVGMKIVGSGKRLMLGGYPTMALWQVVEDRDTKGGLVWPVNGVEGVLPVKPGSLGPWRSIATGKVHPNEPEGPIEVKARIVSMRNGLSVCPGPEGFRLETLIVVNENGTWSPAPVWVGEKLELA